MKKAVIILLGMISFWSASAQEYLGLANSNYGGINSLALQPASIVDNRVLFEINLASLDFEVGNNLFAYNKKAAGGFESLFNGDLFDSTGINQLIATTYSPDKARLFFNTNSIAPLSFMYSHKDKWSIAFTTRLRSSLNVSGVTNGFYDLILNGVPDDFEGFSLENESMHIELVAWGEAGVTYGQKLMDMNGHVLNGALTAKYVVPAFGAYFKIDNVNFTVPDSTTVEVPEFDVSYGVTSSLIDEEGTVGGFNGLEDIKTSLGFDFGVQYEYRPKGGEFSREEFLQEDDPAENKYKYKVGFSILDLGTARSGVSALTNEFSLNSETFSKEDLDSLNYNISAVDSFLTEKFTANEKIEVLKFSLPTAISVQFDYQVIPRVYVNSVFIFGVNPKNPGARTATRLSITPRWEQRFFAVALPVSYDSYNKMNVGLNLRAWFLSLGTNNLISTLVGSNVRSANFYTALKIPIYKKMFAKKKKNAILERSKDRNIDIENITAVDMKGECFEGMSEEQALQKAKREYSDTKVPGITYSYLIAEEYVQLLKPIYQKDPENTFIQQKVNGKEEYTLGKFNTLQELDIFESELKKNGLDNPKVLAFSGNKQIPLLQALRSLCEAGR